VKIGKRIDVVIAAAVTVGLAASCNTNDLLCVQDDPPSLKVFVVDSVTGVDLSALARGAATSTRGADRLMYAGGPSPSFLFGGHANKPGPYTIQVEATGYRPWTAANIMTNIEPGPCSAPPVVVLTARLLAL
jgi:hypothetical protein